MSICKNFNKIDNPSTILKLFRFYLQIIILQNLNTLNTFEFEECKHYNILLSIIYCDDAQFFKSYIKIQYDL